MKKTIVLLFRPALLAVVAIFAAFAASAQPAAAPREEKLLNGLRVLVFSDPSAAKISVRTRIHAGAAFDPLGKEGVMKMLSDIIFPSDSAREYFRDDLGGSLEIVCNYDYIQINATGDPDKLLPMLETLSAAVMNPQINKETTERVRAPHLARLAELEKDPAYLADRAAARRLLGNFPYGRPMFGTVESVSKADFADILFAKQRFLTADNATVAISGNVKADFALRAAKRLYGGWLKSDNKVPATFAQPAPPLADVLIVNSAADSVSELRFAMRGIARNDRDYFASKIVESVVASRLRGREGDRSFARAYANLLPGVVMIGVSAWNTGTVRQPDNSIRLPENFGGFANGILGSDISAAEFDSARAGLSEYFAKYDRADHWMDAQTFRLTSVKDDQTLFQSLTIADAQRFLERLRKQPMASILLVSAAKPAVANQ